MHGYVASVSEGIEGASPSNAQHTRSLPHIQEIWGGIGQSPSRGNSPVRSRWIRANLDTLEVVLAQAARKSDEQADRKVARVAKVQFEKHEGVLNARRLQSILDVHISNMCCRLNESPWHMQLRLLVLISYTMHSFTASVSPVSGSPAGINSCAKKPSKPVSAIALAIGG